MNEPDQDNLSTELRDIQEAYARTRDELERLRLELYEWRERALVAEAAKTEWDMWRTRRGWRVYMALLELRGRIAPSGSRRDRVVNAALKSPVRRRRSAPDASSATIKAVLFLSGQRGDPMRYRCDHQGEAFGISGGTFDVRYHSKADLDLALDTYNCFVLHRVPWSSRIEQFIAGAQARGKPVIFDADDLVFDPDAAHNIALLEREDVRESVKIFFRDTLYRCRRTIRACDAVMASTVPLAERARELHPCVAVAYNVVTSEMTEQADALRRQTPPDGQTIRIGYLSGSPSHDRDFREAAEAVIWALRTFPRTRFVAVGDITLDERFDKFSARIERIPMQPWKRLPEILASIDINLAPLEPDNPFTECKSCLKYIEAGLLGVPTIASPRADFVRAIRQGVNGLLAEGPEAWRESLRRLIESPDLRVALGQAAHDDVRRNHTTGARSRALYATLAELSGETEERPLSINLVTTGRDSFGDFAKLPDGLGKLGHRVEVHTERDTLPTADVTVGTSWRTAATVAAHQRSLFKCLYVNALEPELTQEALAAFGLPLRHLCHGSQLAERLSRVTGKPADPVEDERQLGDHLQRLCFVRIPQDSFRLRA